MVEELLELFVDKVNPQLFEGVEIEDFETGNIQDTDEVISGKSFLIEGQVTLGNKPMEDTSVKSLSHGSNSPGDLVNVLTLGDPFVTDTDSGLDQGADEVVRINSEHLGSTVSLVDMSFIDFSLFFTWTLLELHDTHVHDTSHKTITIEFLFRRELEDIEGFISQGAFFLIVDSFNGQFGLSDEPVISEWTIKEKFFLETNDLFREDLVEDVVATFSRSLTDDTRFFEKI